MNTDGLEKEVDDSKNSPHRHVPLNFDTNSIINLPGTQVKLSFIMSTDVRVLIELDNNAKDMVEAANFRASIKLLQQHGITMLPTTDDTNILSSILETGHSVVLTGKWLKRNKSLFCEKSHFRCWKGSVGHRQVS